jgi:hypothetical protein
MEKLNSEVIGSYLKIETAQIIDVISKELKDLGIASTHTSHGYGTIDQWYLNDISLNDGRSELKGQIYLRNAEVPGTALMLYVGAYRFICANGLVLGIGDGGRLIHRPGPKADDFLEGAAAMIRNSLIDLKGDLQETIDETQSLEVLDPISIVGNLPIQLSVKDTVINNIFWKNTRENTSNVWGLYNELNEQIRRRSKKSSTALVKDIGLVENIQILANDQLNRKAA